MKVRLAITNLYQQSANIQSWPVAYANGGSSCVPDRGSPGWCYPLAVSGWNMLVCGCWRFYSVSQSTITYIYSRNLCPHCCLVVRMAKGATQSTNYDIPCPALMYFVFMGGGGEWEREREREREMFYWTIVPVAKVICSFDGRGMKCKYVAFNTCNIHLTGTIFHASIGTSVHLEYQSYRMFLVLACSEHIAESAFVF